MDRFFSDGNICLEGPYTFTDVSVVFIFTKIKIIFLPTALYFLYSVIGLHVYNPVNEIKNMYNKKMSIK